jgi:tetratricopeptide (TPR) repeat protein
MKQLLFIPFFILLSCSSTKNISQVEESKLIPNQELNSQEEGWLKLGIISHDEKDYAQAKEYYQRILDRKPNSSEALYEISYSSMEQNELDEALNYIKVGEKIDSDSRFLFYHMKGISLDRMGKSEEAVEAFKNGLEINPDFHLLHYSLAITSINLGNTKQGLKSLKNSVNTNFEHSSSHYLLGNTYRNLGDNIPALLAYTYFLFYESNSPRSEEAFNAIYDIISSAKNDTNSNQINITLSSIMGSSEEQIDGLETVLAITSATRFTDEKELTKIEFIVSSYDRLVSLLAESQDKYPNKNFLRSTYVPYLIKVHQEGYLETLLYLLFENSGFEGVDNWIINECVKCEEFYEWTPE